MAGVGDAFKALVRRIAGLPTAEGEPPVILYLGRFRATVVAQNADRTLEVQPEDQRISGQKNVRMRLPIPNAEVTVAPGAVVLLCFERGDPSQAYCAPEWEDGATLQQLVLNALALYLGGQPGALAAARKTDAVGAATTMAAWISSVTTAAQTIDPTIVQPTDFGIITGGSSVVSIK